MVGDQCRIAIHAEGRLYFPFLPGSTAVFRKIYIIDNGRRDNIVLIPRVYGDGGFTNIIRSVRFIEFDILELSMKATENRDGQHKYQAKYSHR